MKRHSVKRDKILKCLRGTKSHPSADWIYRELKPTVPDLSLATVYRNLNQLREAGDIASMGVVSGEERFDGNTAPHTHVICIRCGKIMDVEEIGLPDQWAETVSRVTGFETRGAFLQCFGVCPECSGKDDAQQIHPGQGLE